MTVGLLLVSRELVAFAGFALLVIAAVYSLLVCISIAVWRARKPPSVRSTELPRVTLLKPLCGVESGLEENLRSFCLQDYPCFQIIFGIADPNDAAIHYV